MVCKDLSSVHLKSIEELTRLVILPKVFMFDEEGEGEYEEEFEDLEDIDLDGQKVDDEENLFEEGMYDDEEEEKETDEDDDFEPFADYDNDDEAAEDEGDEF